MTRSLGMTFLAVYLVVVGVAGVLPIGIPFQLTAVLALLAGVFILIGK